MRKLFVVVSTTLSLIALPALAQGTAKQKAACERDSHKYCASAEPDAIAVEKCLKEHMSKLSKACQRQFGKGHR
jgi:hypothetical protein